MDQFSSPIDAAPRPLSVAIVAMGGQGGGVLADWICTVARSQDYHVQATSVAGVAQRTGATIYYIEMIRRDGTRAQPVLSLMPAPGDVDVVIASELMEAGRAILRGIVTPDRTTLIASTQRAFAISEKEKPGDGIADGTAVYAAATFAARRQIVGDFARIAEESGSVISASLLGALAASEALPFPHTAFEQAVKDGGIGVKASLRAFSRAYEQARAASAPQQEATAASGRLDASLPPATGVAQLDALVERIRSDLPIDAHALAYAGVRHVVDFQDAAYGGEYLDTLAGIAKLDHASGGAAHAYELTVETARHLARGMAYDDVIRVADLKTRPSRDQRVVHEVAVDRNRQVLQTTEYFHPRMEEVCATLPKGIGAAIERRAWLMRLLNGFVNRGRRIRTDSVLGYTQLYFIAGRKSKRRGTLRHGREMAHVTQWLSSVRATAPANYALAVELVKVRRLIKGYSDTMARGLSKYDRVMTGAKAVAARADAADWVRRLQQAALADEDGTALDGALKTIATLDAEAGSASTPKRNVKVLS